MIFVDTSAWAALAIKQDKNHSVAKSWANSNASTLVTTDYIIDETLTLLLNRGSHQHAVQFGNSIFANGLAELVTVSEADFNNAWNVFQQFEDKSWSFTDCVSRVVIERLEVTEAFAFDRHFHQFGNLSVLPLDSGAEA